MRDVSVFGTGGVWLTGVAIARRAINHRVRFVARDIDNALRRAINRHVFIAFVSRDVKTCHDIKPRCAFRSFNNTRNVLMKRKRARHQTTSRTLSRYAFASFVAFVVDLRDVRLRAFATRFAYATSNAHRIASYSR